MELTATKYKQTEVGLIPKDWSLQPLKEYLSENPKYGIGAAAVDFNSNYPTYLRITDIDEAGNLIKEGLKSVDHLDSSNYILEEGEIVFARTGASVGKSYLFNKKDGELVYAGFLIKIKPDPKKLSAEYLSKYVTTGKYWHWVIVNSMRSGQPGINSQEYGLLPILLPPTLTEQKAIAQVLSDTDALIQALEKKIAKKKDIKKGVMQKLLTPKENWKESKVASVGQPYGGMSGKTKADFSNGNAHYVPFMNVMSNPITDTGYLDSVNINKGESQNKIIKGDLLFNGSSETPEEVGFCSAVLEQIDNLYLNSFCFGFRIFNSKQYDSLFLAYFFRSTLGRNFFYSLAQGATRYNLSKTNFLKSILTLPIYEDQVQIATLIRDIDSEIENLDQKLRKYHLAKQGMMQQLLTGKIRLI